MNTNKSTLGILVALSAVVGFMAIDDYIWVEAVDPVVSLIPVEIVERTFIIPPKQGNNLPEDKVLVEVWCFDEVGNVPSNQTAMNPFVSYGELEGASKISIEEGLQTINDGSFGGAFLEVLPLTPQNTTMHIGVECYINAP